MQNAHKLSEGLKLSWGVRNHRGFFMRAEDFFGYQKRISKLQNEFKADKEEFDSKFIGYARMLSAGSIQGHINSLNKKYGENPDAFSHGESFLNLFINRVVPKGLYILDEPEVPLSPKRQLSLISIILKSVAENSQFIIATHSPILMAIPNATIYEIKDEKLQIAHYNDLEHVAITRDFLKSPESFIKHLG